MKLLLGLCDTAPSSLSKQLKKCEAWKMSNVHLFYQNQALPLGRDTSINCFSNTNFKKKRWTRVILSIKWYNKDKVRYPRAVVHLSALKQNKTKNTSPSTPGVLRGSPYLNLGVLVSMQWISSLGKSGTRICYPPINEGFQNKNINYNLNKETCSAINKLYNAKRF